MKILITGAGGQVGSELIRQGQNRGLQMIAAKHSELDITSQDSVESFIKIKQPGMVINAAAYTAVDKAESEPESAYGVNRDGAANLARSCADSHIPLLHISTDYVFDGDKKGSYFETDPTNPQGIYGKSKLAGEQAVKSILQQHLILRVSWVFGANGNNFVKTMLRMGRERKNLRVVMDQHGGPTWAGDIAATLISLATRWHDGNNIPWGIYHYSGQPVTTWYEFAGAVFPQARKLEMIAQLPVIEPVPGTEYPTLAGRPLNSQLCCLKISQELGISQPDWHIGLNNTLTEWKNNETFS